MIFHRDSLSLVRFRHIIRRSTCDTFSLRFVGFWSFQTLADIIRASTSNDSSLLFIEFGPSHSLLDTISESTSVDLSLRLTEFRGRSRHFQISPVDQQVMIPTLRYIEFASLQTFADLISGSTSYDLLLCSLSLGRLRRFKILSANQQMMICHWDSLRLDVSATFRHHQRTSTC